MTDLNHVVLIGRLTRDLGSSDLDFGYLPNGTAKARVSIAVNRRRKNGEEWVDDVSYFDIEIFGKSAENLKPYLLRGKQIGVDGYLKQHRWQDQQGNNRSRVVVVTNQVQLLGGKNDDSDDEQDDEEPAREKNAGKPRFTPRPKAQQPQEYNGEEFPEDIPF